MLLLLVVAALTGARALDLQNNAYYGTKGGHHTTVDINRGIYGNNSYSSLTADRFYQPSPASEPATGVCFREVPTKSLSNDPSQHLKGNGSSPDMSRIRSCCPGYTRNIHNHLICDPVCSKPCYNGVCAAPDTCTCYPDHVLNSTGVCVSTCPIGCKNGQCYGSMCRCNEGYTLDINRKYCIPQCSDNCGGSGYGICLAPNSCSCKPGYEPTPTGSCRPSGYNPLQNNLYNQLPQNQGNYSHLYPNLHSPNQNNPGQITNNPFNQNQNQNNPYNQNQGQHSNTLNQNQGQYLNSYNQNQGQHSITNQNQNQDQHYNSYNQNQGQHSSNNQNQNQDQHYNAYNQNQGQHSNSYNQNQGSTHYNQNGQQYYNQTHNQSSSAHNQHSFSNQSSYNQMTQINNNQLSNQPGLNNQNNHNPGSSQNPGQSHYQTTLYPGQTTQYPGQTSLYPGQTTQYPGQTTQHPGQSQYPGQSNPNIYQQNYTSPSLNSYNQMQPGQNHPIQSNYPNPNPYPYWEPIQGYGDESQVPRCSQPCINGVCVQGNRCSCNPGYELDNADPSGTRCRPRCAGGCENGVCSAPNFCICNMGYRKEQGVKGAAARCVRRMKRSLA